MQTVMSVISIKRTDCVMFANRLKQARMANGFSPSAFAAKIGVAKGLVDMWEAGHKEPNYHILRKISLALGCSIDWLLQDA